MAGKRNSYDEERLVSSLSQVASLSKTSSLPRNTRMVMEPRATMPSGNLAADSAGHLAFSCLHSRYDGNNMITLGTGVTVTTTTEAMPTQSVPTEAPSVARGEEGAKVEGELSRGESVESLRSDRSFTEESETKYVCLCFLSTGLHVFSSVVRGKQRNPGRRGKRRSQCLQIYLSSCRRWTRVGGRGRR